MKNNVLSYANRTKLKKLKTPEDILAFAQKFITPRATDKAPTNESDVEVEETAETTMSEASPKRVLLPRGKMSAAQKLQLTDANTISPWYDVVDNDTEAMTISLYAKGLTTRDISNYLRNMHGIEIAQPSISAITDKVFPLVKEWQTRTLSACYPVVYLDGLHFKVRDTGKITSKVAYIVLGVNQYGTKEVLGIWVSESEGAKFWLHVLNDLKTRGVDDILIACVDGLKGFPEAIKTIFPLTDVQVCITHQIRHTIMFISYKDKKQFCDELKSVYNAPTEEAGMDALKEMEERWPQYRSYLKSWETRWADLAPFFGYPEPIRRMVYTTNAIENLNRQFRKVTKTTTVFPHDDALIKLLWLAQADFTQTWVFAVRNWGEIMAQLNILFPDRINF
jgi:transposase-like protein